MTDESFMEVAIEEAILGKAEGDLPFGAVVVCDGKLISRNHSRAQIVPDVAAHAELQAVRQACGILDRTNLKDCTIFCSNEPCVMCAAIIFQAKIARVVIGASRDDIPMLRPRKINIDQLAEDSGYRIEIIRGVLKDRVIELFKDVEK